MSPRTIAAMPAALCLMALLGGSDCKERSREEAQANAEVASRDAGSADHDFDREILPYIPPVELGVKTGKIDSRNRYSSAVRVYAKGIGSDETPKLCSGVLVSPRLVLTAASCVCSQQQAAQSDGGHAPIDGKTCVALGTMEWATYIPPTRDHAPGAYFGEYNAAVRVHPGFKQVLDERGNVISSEADLAVFVLDKAADLPLVELAESDIKAGESLIIVGHGIPLFSGAGERVFSEHRVTEVLGSGGRVAFVQPPPFLYIGARGGPCLRQTRQGLRLFGILSATLGQEALFTSVYPYRDWVRAQIQSAADAGSSMPQPPP